MKDANHPWFRPLWVRVLLVAIAAGWGLFEYHSGSEVWAIVFGAIAAFGVWSFFIAYDPEDGGPGDKGGA